MKYQSFFSNMSVFKTSRIYATSTYDIRRRKWNSSELGWSKRSVINLPEAAEARFQSPASNDTPILKPIEWTFIRSVFKCNRLLCFARLGCQFWHKPTDSGAILRHSVLAGASKRWIEQEGCFFSLPCPTPTSRLPWNVRNTRQQNCGWQTFASNFSDVVDIFC